MAFRLRYQAHDEALALGEFVIGRSIECQLSLDDPLVSRRHAILRVSQDTVTVQDLGSRNGVLVNGTKIEGVCSIGPGDKIAIGSQEMLLYTERTTHPHLNRDSDDIYRRATQTLGAAFVVDLRNAASANGGALPGSAPAGGAISDPPTPE